MKKIANELEMLLAAKKGGYAVGAFNFSSIEVMRAIIDAAEQARSPVIIALSEGGLKYASGDYIQAVMQAVLKNTSVPIALHLDHGKSFEKIQEVIELGFYSVMIDGSSLPFEENIALTKKVVDYAHSKGVVVEGELGVLAGIEDNVSATENKYTEPQQAKEFIQKTGVDSLAIAIGTSHGAYKFAGESQLRFDILKEITQLVPNTPLVLHGASSVPQKYIDIINQYGGQINGAKGVSEDLVSQASTLGISKINCDTDIRMVFTASMREFLYKNPGEFTPRKYLQYCKEQVRDFVIDKMEKVYHSANTVK